MSEQAAAAVIPPREVVLTGERPQTVTATVVSIERHEESGVFGAMVGLEAVLHVVFPGYEKPNTYVLSRLVDESAWVLDARFGANGFPFFSHGFGSRCTVLSGVHKVLGALLDEAARKLGLVAAIGDDVPLVLASTESTGTDAGA
ncbi:MAG TPA: hypothetical protein VGO89_04340 [Streptomyces sp.]|jgi:hypothetical protein|nr:hypothetical protein [Streptomyces sp.]